MRRDKAEFIFHDFPGVSSAVMSKIFALKISVKPSPPAAGRLHLPVRAGLITFQGRTCLILIATSNYQTISNHQLSCRVLPMHREEQGGCEIDIKEHISFIFLVRSQFGHPFR